MGIADVKSALATTLAAVTGIKVAAYRVPRSLAAAELPYALVLTGPATYSAVGPLTDADMHTRTYVVRLYVVSISAGTTGEAEALVEPFFARIPAAIAANPRLTRTCLRATVTRDSGIRVWEFVGQEYLGTEFTVEVQA